MVYHNKDSAADLRPTLMIVSVVTAIVFGAGYFAYSSSSHVQDESATTSVSSHSHV